MMPREREVRVLVVGDDHLARAGLAVLLDDQRGCAVVGQIAGPEYDPTAARVYGAEVVVWDLGWDPDRAYGDLAAAQDGELPVVVLVPDESHAAEVWASGARGVLLRDAEGTTLVSALEAAVHGLAVLDPVLALALGPASGDMSPPSVSQLTPRELEVLGLLAEGMANKTIALQLGISEHTVKFHVNAILGKLGAQSRTEAVTRATRMGLIAL